MIKQYVFGTTLAIACSSLLAGGPAPTHHSKSFFDVFSPFTQISVGYGKYSGKNVNSNEIGMYDIKVGFAWHAFKSVDLLGLGGMVTGDSVRPNDPNTSPDEGYKIKDNPYLEVGAAYNYKRLLLQALAGVEAMKASPLAVKPSALPIKNAYYFMTTFNAGLKWSEHTSALLGFQYVFGGNGTIERISANQRQFKDLSKSWAILFGINYTL